MATFASVYRKSIRAVVRSVEMWLAGNSTVGVMASAEQTLRCALLKGEAELIAEP